MIERNRTQKLTFKPFLTLINHINNNNNNKLKKKICIRTFSGVDRFVMVSSVIFFFCQTAIDPTWLRKQNRYLLVGAKLRIKRLINHKIGLCCELDIARKYLSTKSHKPLRIKYY